MNKFEVDFYESFSGAMKAIVYIKDFPERVVAIPTVDEMYHDAFMAHVKNGFADWENVCERCAVYATASRIRENDSMVAGYSSETDTMDVYPKNMLTNAYLRFLPFIKTDAVVPPDEIHPYKSGLILGRFQTFHNGHVAMVKKALQACGVVFLFIGSSQESNTQKNPYDYDMRRDMIASVFDDEMRINRLIIRPLPDIGVGNNSKWGEYVLEQCIQQFGDLPEVMISGKEDRRTSWFAEDIDEMFIAKTVNVSATDVRDAMLRDDKETWSKYMPKELWCKYNHMRRLLYTAQKNTDTASL